MGKIERELYSGRGIFTVHPLNHLDGGLILRGTFPPEKAQRGGKTSIPPPVRIHSFVPWGGKSMMMTKHPFFWNAEHHKPQQNIAHALQPPTCKNSFWYVCILQLALGYQIFDRAEPLCDDVGQFRANFQASSSDNNPCRSNSNSSWFEIESITITGACVPHLTAKGELGREGGSNYFDPLFSLFYLKEFFTLTPWILCFLNLCEYSKDFYRRCSEVIQWILLEFLVEPFLTARRMSYSTCTLFLEKNLMIYIQIKIFYVFI